MVVQLLISMMNWESEIRRNVSSCSSIDTAYDPAGPPPVKVMSNAPNLLVGMFWGAWDLKFQHRTALEPKDKYGKGGVEWRT